jgi:molybdopterin biosynthesis enzyme
VVGRVPPGIDSAGVLVGELAGDGVACKGCPGVPVACVMCMRFCARNSASERPTVTNPVVTSIVASHRSRRMHFRSKGDSSFIREILREENGRLSPMVPAGTCG